MPVDRRTLADLAVFARVEAAAADIEPWAAVLAAVYRRGTLGGEAAAWAVKLYNAFDDLGSAWRLMAAWPSPAAWAAAPDTAEAARLPCGRERRNLRGGLVIRHLDSYVAALGGGGQLTWLRDGFPGVADHGSQFDALMRYMRRSVWGTGRQSAFEWAEFAGKVLGLPVRAHDGCLWESSGPRESLERIYNDGGAAPSQAWLDAKAVSCRERLAIEGASLDWWDFETVICDFNVMRKGRYYPGQHLAMIREEIETLPAGPRDELMAAFTAAVPAPWRDIPPGVDKKLAAAYRATGKIRTPFGTLT